MVDIGDIDEFELSQPFYQTVSSEPGENGASTSAGREAKHLLVLDSSFNPPHKGHLALVLKALASSGDKREDVVVLLLLSVNNADKKKQLALFKDRVAMMQLLAAHLHSQAGMARVVVGITNQARFADKALVLAREPQFRGLELSFLVGYDTLTRIFDTRYYTNGLGELVPFMRGCDIYCLARGESEDESSAFIDRLPYDEWKEKIKLVPSDELNCRISSSAIRRGLHSLSGASSGRNAASEEDTGPYSDTIATIAAFIRQRDPYRLQPGTAQSQQ